MKKISLLLVGLLLLVVSCVQSVDCDDAACLKKALGNCSPASLMVDGEVPELKVGGGVSTTSGTLRTTYTIEGWSNGECQYTVEQQVRGEQNVNVGIECIIPQAFLGLYVQGDTEAMDRVANEFCKTKNVQIIINDTSGK